MGIKGIHSKWFKMWTCGDSSDMSPAWRCTWLGAESARRIFPLMANVRPFISRSLSSLSQLVTTCQRSISVKLCKHIQTIWTHLDLLLQIHLSRSCSCHFLNSFFSFLVMSSLLFLSREARKTIVSANLSENGSESTLTTQHVTTCYNWALHEHCQATGLVWKEKARCSLKSFDRCCEVHSQSFATSPYCRYKQKHHVASPRGGTSVLGLPFIVYLSSSCIFRHASHSIHHCELQGFFNLYCVGHDMMNEWSIEYKRVKLDVSNRISKPSFSASLSYQWMQSIYPRSWKVVLSCALDHDCEVALGWQSFAKVFHDVRTHDIECAQNQLAISCTACTKHRFISLMWAAK